MKIPKTLKVGGFKYTILFPYSFSESNDLVGQHCFEDLLIKISETDRLDVMSDQKIIATLLHEIVHAIDTVYFEEHRMAEEEVDLIARGLFQIINTNRFEMNKIPRSINILGFKYKVYYPYKFIDEETCVAMAYHEKCLFCIAKSGRIEVSFSYFLSQIISSLFSINMIADQPNSLRLGRGLYDVLMNNNWVIPLIKGV